MDKWETVIPGDVERLWVTGGWLYQVSCGYTGVSVVFVPDPDHDGLIPRERICDHGYIHSSCGDCIRATR